MNICLLIDDYFELKINKKRFHDLFLLEAQGPIDLGSGGFEGVIDGDV